MSSSSSSSSRMSCNTSPLKTKDLHRIFKMLDKNGDGFLSLEELNWLLESIGVHATLEELKSSVGKPSLCFYDFLLFYGSITKHYDHDGNEAVDDDEERYIVEAFQVFDIDGDGFISCQELKTTLKRLGLWDENNNDCRTMIRVFDTNSDGVLDFEEFKNMMFQA